MPYLIEKTCGTRTPAFISADHARYLAQSMRVMEVADDGTELGDVTPDAPDELREVQAGQETAGDAGEEAPVAKPAAKKAAKVKK